MRIYVLAGSLMLSFVGLQPAGAEMRPVKKPSSAGSFSVVPNVRRITMVNYMGSKEAVAEMKRANAVEAKKRRADAAAAEAEMEREEAAEVERRGARPTFTDINVDRKAMLESLKVAVEANIRPMLTGYNMVPGSLIIDHQVSHQTRMLGGNVFNDSFWNIQFTDASQGLVKCELIHPKGKSLSIRDCVVMSGTAIVQTDEDVCMPSTGPNLYGRAWKTCPLTKEPRGVQDPIPGKPRAYGYEEKPAKEIEPPKGRTEDGGASGG